MSTYESASDSPRHPEKGAAVDIAERARAIIAIMDFYAQENRVRGIATQRPIADSQFNEFYGTKAARVARGAKGKRDELRHDYHGAMRTLYPQDELVAAGLTDESGADLGYTSFKRQMNETFGGSGAASQKQRRALVEQVKRSTEALGIELSEE